jgi:pimeloyl-ACP methyl ester carboxylesterase/DNA-binding CsgD family transcriptional regulator
MPAMAAPSAPTPRATRDPEHEIRFCRTDDGVRLAYAVHGSGPPLVVASCWLSHLQYDWQSPVWRHFLDDLGDIATVIRYDERGFGLSDWSVDDFSLAARLRDLEAVVEAARLDRFALLGMSGGSAVAMAYAIAHPERVTRLVLYGTVRGTPPRLEGDRLTEEETFRGLIRVGWAREDPTFRRVFTSTFIPDATEEQMRWFDDLQRMSTSVENALASRIGRQQVDIANSLDRIEAPTLILHALGDRATPFECGREVASRIRDARLVPIDSRNHILLADEPAWKVFMREVSAFLAPDRMTWAGPTDSNLGELTERELEVLRLAADGRTNEQIAAALSLSVRTVERHLSNAYLKLGIAGRSARAGAVATVLRADRHAGSASSR